MAVIFQNALYELQIAKFFQGKATRTPLWEGCPPSHTLPPHAPRACGRHCHTLKNFLWRLLPFILLLLQNFRRTLVLKVLHQRHVIIFLLHASWLGLRPCQLSYMEIKSEYSTNCDPPHDFEAKGDSTLITHSHNTPCVSWRHGYAHNNWQNKGGHTCFVLEELFNTLVYLMSRLACERSQVCSWTR